MTSVAGPTQAPASLSAPTHAMRPPLIAIASAHERSASMV
jgi:hypothetical protein